MWTLHKLPKVFGNMADWFGFYELNLHSKSQTWSMVMEHRHTDTQPHTHLFLHNESGSNGKMEMVKNSVLPKNVTMTTIFKVHVTQITSVLALMTTWVFKK